MKTASIVAALAASTCIVALATPAYAQERSYNIPAGSLKAALDAFARQSGRPIIFKADEVRGARSQGYRGTASAETALDAILQGTGFTTRGGASGSIAIVRVGNGQSRPSDDSSAESNSSGATPEILVTGIRQWSLNTGIRRTRDDAQPYVVFDREQIQRSGSTNLEDFFRDYLNANAGGPITANSGYSSQAGKINLRGLGADETLILVDGRRIAPINSGTGTIDQPNITGIPLAAIERIEVLAASASGIYGSNATGGAINIILKRDYSGLEASATYGGTYDGGATQKRFDVAAGTNLFGGKTNIMFTASYQNNGPLYAGQRDFISTYGKRAFGDVPTIIPLGATPNIRSTDGSILSLKPAYGGGSLGSSFTSVPYGYRGVASDGVAGLVANAGRYNFDTAPTAQSGSGTPGGRYPLINQNELFAGTLAIRQEITPWLKGFFEAAGSQNRNAAQGVSILTSIALPVTAPNNPFNQAITVNVPQIGADSTIHFKMQDLRFTGGLIVKLPFGWQGSADYSWDRTSYEYDLPRNVNASQVIAMQNGTIDVLRDLIASPIAYQYQDLGSFSERRPVTATSASLRLAGPLPVTLPGGKPTMTVELQRNRVNMPGARSYTVLNTGATGSTTAAYSPPRALTTDSGYFEAKLPVISADNHIPLINALELQVAARYERYAVDGTLGNITCYTLPRPLTTADLATPCPASGTVVKSARSERSSFNPTYSARWQIVPDLALRGSYSTGYRAPDASRLIPQTASVVIAATDPLRGNSVIGTSIGPFSLIPGFSGGNADVKPEHSTSYTAGAILTPRGIPNLRISVDWTKIVKRDNYYDPTQILLAPFLTGAAGQAIFEEYLAAHPERFTRCGTAAPYTVAPICSIDATTINLAGSRVGAIDFAADYSSKLGGGTLDFSLSATWLYQFDVQVTSGSPVTRWDGVASNLFYTVGGGDGGPAWKGNATLRYSTDRWSLGARGHYFDGYWINSTHTYDTRQHGSSVPAQVFFDLFGSYKIFRGTELSAGVRNVFNRLPAFDASSTTLYSGAGDPRGASYYLTVAQKF